MTDEPTTPPNEPKPRLPRVAWLAAAPAILALVGALLPWFAPTGTGVSIPVAHSWQAGRIGFLAPLAIVGGGIAVLGPRLGLFSKGQPVRPLGRDGMAVLLSGALAAVVIVLAWFLLPASYTFSGGVSWDQLASAGHNLKREPQFGYFISIAAAVLAIGCGAALLVAGRREPA